MKCSFALRDRDVFLCWKTATFAHFFWLGVATCTIIYRTCANAKMWAFPLTWCSHMLVLPQCSMEFGNGRDTSIKGHLQAHVCMSLRYMRILPRWLATVVLLSLRPILTLGPLGLTWACNVLACCSLRVCRPIWPVVPSNILTYSHAGQHC